MLGIVGESGSGKSVSSFSILKLIEPPGVVESDGILSVSYTHLSLPQVLLRKRKGMEQAGKMLREHQNIFHIVVHADKDYRCTLANGLEMFAALKLHGVESKPVSYTHLWVKAVFYP